MQATARSYPLALSLDNIRQMVKTSGFSVCLESIPSKSIANKELAEIWEVMQFRMIHLAEILANAKDSTPKTKRKAA